MSTQPQLPDDILAYLAAVRERVEAEIDGACGCCRGVGRVRPPGRPGPDGNVQCWRCDGGGNEPARIHADVPTLLALLEAESDMCRSLADRITELEAESLRQSQRCIRAAVIGNEDNKSESVPEMLADLGRKHIDEIEPELERLRGEATARKTLDERPVDDDLNVLWNRCEDREPLSIAEQRELYLWLQEKDVIIGDYDEKIVGLEAIIAKLPKCRQLTVGGRLVQDCPVVPGMELWFETDHQTIECEAALQFVAHLWDSILTRFGWVRLSQCCNSRQAAEAKAAEEKGENDTKNH